MMDLLTVKTREEFDGYYRSNGLNTVDQKINHLMDATGVKAIRGGGSENQDVTLALLEESTLHGYWKDLQ
jgi:hypothetical protein